jgi:hypothetical protein
MTDHTTNDWRVPLITKALSETDATKDEAEAVGTDRVEVVARAAVTDMPLGEAFDTRVHGAQMDILSTLQILLLDAQIVLILIVIWKQANRSAMQSEFKRAIEERRPNHENRKRWLELAAKVYELLTKERFMVTILFLAANPTDATRLALDVEYRDIQARLRAIPERDRFKLAHAPAIQAKELTNEILQSRPDIVHFSGHGSPLGELVLVDANNRAAPVNRDAVAELLRVFSDRVRCVVLNACFSRPQAELIAQHVEATVGIPTPVGDSAAITFSETFYNALGHGEPLQNAFDLGRNAIRLLGIPQSALPELICRADADPKRIAF